MNSLHVQTTAVAVAPPASHPASSRECGSKPILKLKAHDESHGLGAFAPVGRALHAAPHVPRVELKTEDKAEQRDGEEARFMPLQCCMLHGE